MFENYYKHMKKYRVMGEDGIGYYTDDEFESIQIENGKCYHEHKIINPEIKLCGNNIPPKQEWICSRCGERGEYALNGYWDGIAMFNNTVKIFDIK